METKFSNDEFYAMYKKYKQKYLDLKNNVLEGGSSSLTDAFNLIQKYQNDSDIINNYNNIISLSKFNDKMKESLLYNKVNEKQISEKILKFTKLKELVTNHNTNIFYRKKKKKKKKKKKEEKQ